jgi:hypothetical protein
MSEGAEGPVFPVALHRLVVRAKSNESVLRDHEAVAKAQVHT